MNIFKHISLIYLLILLPTHFSILLNEIDKSDWHMKTIGPTKFCQISSNNYAVVATDKGVLAAIDPFYGNLKWRTVFDEGEDIVEMKSSYLFISALTKHKKLYTVDEKYGVLYTQVAEGVLDFTHISNNSGLATDVCVLTENNKIFTLNLRSNTLGWTIDDPNFKFVRFLPYKKGDTHIYVLAYTQDKLCVCVYNKTDGQFVRAYTTDFRNQFIFSDITHTPQFITHSLDQLQPAITIYYTHPEDNELTILTITVDDITGELTHTSHTFSETNISVNTHYTEQPFLVVQNEHKTIVVSIIFDVLSETGIVYKMKEFEGDVKIGPVHIYNNNSFLNEVTSLAFVYGQNNEGTVTFSYYTHVYESSEVLTSFYQGDDKIYRQISWFSVQLTNNKYTLVVSYDDATITNYQIENGHTQNNWERVEALSNITHTVFYDIKIPPKTHGIHLISHEVISFLRVPSLKNFFEIFTHIDLLHTWSEIKSFVNYYINLLNSSDTHYHGTTPPTEPIKYLNYTFEEKQAIVCGNFNYMDVNFSRYKNKISHTPDWQTVIITITGHDTVCAIHSTTGLILWTANINCVCKGCDVEIDYVDILGHNRARYLLVVYHYTHENKHITRVESFDIHTGRSTSSSTVNKHFTHIFPMYEDAEDSTRELDPTLLIGVDSTHTTQLLTPTHTLNEKEEEKINKDFFFYEGSTHTHTINGYTLTYNKTTLGIETNKIWDIDFHNTDEHIISYTHTIKPAKPTVSFQVTGDVSVLYRYNNPHLLYIITQTNNTHTLPRNEPTQLLTIYAIDILTGYIIHSELLPIGATTPINIVASGHFAFVYYWNSFKERYETRSIEIFGLKSLSDPLDILFSTPSKNGDDTHTHSTNWKKPTVLGSTHIFPTAISSLAVTSTHQGITPKNILVGLKSSQLYNFPRQLVNVRNPVFPQTEKNPKLNSTEQLEGLLPYKPILYINDNDILSYTHKINRIKNIITHPSKLESTSLVFTHGLDLFFTLACPAQKFDTLRSDFNTPLAFMFIFMAIFGVFYTRKMAKERQRNFKWN